MATLEHKDPNANEFGRIESHGQRDHDLVRKVEVKRATNDLSPARSAAKRGIAERAADSGPKEPTAAESQLLERRSRAIKGESAADDLSQSLGRRRGGRRGIAGRSAQRGITSKDAGKERGIAARSRIRRAMGTAKQVAKDTDVDGQNGDLGDTVGNATVNVARGTTRRGISRLRALHKKGRAAQAGSIGGTLDSAEVAADGARKAASPNLRRANVRLARKAAKATKAGGVAGTALASTGEAEAAVATKTTITAVVETVKATLAAVGAGIGTALGGVFVATAPFLVVIVIVTSIFSALSVFFQNGGGSGGGSGYIEQALKYADDNSIGYSQARRFHNPDMDCSSFVYYSLIDSGSCTTKQLGSSPFATFGMKEPLQRAGFTIIPFSQIGGPAKLKKGDILVNISDHTEIYIGDGKDVAAHADRGHPEGGDQTGTEVCVSGYYYDGWDYVARPPASMLDTGGSVSGTERSIWNWLKKQGYSDAAAAGIMGNAYGESGCKSNALQNGHGPAAGLFQWETYGSMGSRWGNLYNYAKSKGKQWTDCATQLEFMQSELNGLVNLSQFKSTNDVDWATTTFERKFERAGIPRMQARLDAAHGYLKKFGGKS